jgi:hypothetical protein
MNNIETMTVEQLKNLARDLREAIDFQGGSVAIRMAAMTRLVNVEREIDAR